MNCKNHDEVQSHYQCETCHNYFCNECIMVRRFTSSFTAHICKECGGKCKPLVDNDNRKDHKPLAQEPQPAVQPKEDEKPVESPVVPAIASEEKKAEAPLKKTPRDTKAPQKPRFFRRLPGVLIFPLKRRGLIVVALGGIFMFLLSFVSKNLKMLELPLEIIFITYAVIYLFKVAEDSSKGSHKLQNFPNLDYWIGMTKPLICISLALLLCLGPAHAYFFMISKNFDAVYILLTVLGVFFLPMFLVGIVLSRKISAINPARVVTSIFNTFLPYFVTCIFVYGCIFLLFYVNVDIVYRHQKVGNILSHFLIVYIILIQVRFLGIFAQYLYQKTHKEQ